MLENDSDLNEIDALIENNLIDKALEKIRFKIAQDQSSAHSYYLLGLCLRKTGDLNSAKQALLQSTQLNPSDTLVLFALANVYKNLGEYQQAESGYLKIIAIDATHAKAFFNLGVVYQLTHKIEKAISAYKQAITLQPDYAEAFNNLGNIYKNNRHAEQAKKCFEQAIHLKPIPDSYYNLAVTLQQLNQPLLAVQAYQQAAQLKPDYLNAWLGLALLHQKMGNYSQAVNAFKRAIVLNPVNAEVYNSLGITLIKMKLLEPAIAAFTKALEVDPSYTEALGSLVQQKMHACDWKNLQSLFDALVLAIENGGDVVPFNLLATPLSAETQKKCALHYTQKHYPALTPLTNSNTRHTHKRIRIGYFSADLHNHATAYLMADLFKTHDRNLFEIIAFSFGPVKNDEMAVLLKRRFDQLHYVNSLSDSEVAELARNCEIDIAIDLKGYTRGARPNIFAYKPAPVQVSYLGYPGTLGAEYFDYIIADPTIIPISEQRHYSEKIAYMPDTYQVNAKRKVLAQDAMTHTDHGLPEDAFVFCCFNNNYKITPDVFEIWMRLLKRTANSVLWLFEANPTAKKHLTETAKNMDIEPERLIFAKKVSQEEHLNRYYFADLVLDTFYYNAHTTTSDALWVGCPVITCIGKTFPSRVAASILKAHGISELITESPKAYEDLALALAHRPEQLNMLRKKILTHKTSHALFDIKKYTGNLEHLYQQMYERHLAGLPAENLMATT